MVHPDSGAVPPQDPAPARRLAALVLVLGVIQLLFLHAPPTWWPVPLGMGPLDPELSLAAIRRDAGGIDIEVAQTDRRTRVQIRHAESHGAHGEPAGRYVVAGDAPPRARQVVVDRLRAWESLRPRPPALVRADGRRPRTLHVVEEVVAELALLLGLVLLTWHARRLWQTLGWNRPQLAVVLALLAVHLAMVEGLGLHGVWHSNQHGYERLADVVHGTPPPLGHLANIHGQGFYVLAGPVFAVLGQVLGVLRALHLIAMIGLVAWAAWLHLFFDRDARARWAFAALCLSPVVLRIAPTESMYVPAFATLGAALLCLELHLRTGATRWLAAALPWAFLATQTRGELLGLVPAIFGWMILSRQPTWLRTTLPRKSTLASLGLVAVASLPRLAALTTGGSPESSERALDTLLGDPRLVPLVAALALAVWWVPGVGRPLASGRRIRWPFGVTLGVVLAVGTAAVVRASRPGAYMPAWTLAPVFDPDYAGPWLVVLALGGLAVLARTSSAQAAFLIGAVAGCWLLYVPHQDSISTYVRTGLTTEPFVSAAIGVSLHALAVRMPAGALLSGALLAGSVGWSLPFLTTRYPKQQLWDLVKRLPALVEEDAVIVWLSIDDAPPDPRNRTRTRRFALPRHLPSGLEAVPIHAYDATDPRPTYFLRTPGCHRPLLEMDPQRAWLGTRETPWRYLLAPDVSPGPRIAVDDLDPSVPWIDPACARLLSVAGPPRIEVVLHPGVAGSIYEEIPAGPGVIGLYPL